MYSLSEVLTGLLMLRPPSFVQVELILHSTHNPLEILSRWIPKWMQVELGFAFANLERVSSWFIQSFTLSVTNSSLDETEPKQALWCFLTGKVMSDTCAFEDLPYFYDHVLMLLRPGLWRNGCYTCFLIRRANVWSLAGAQFIDCDVS